MGNIPPHGSPISGHIFGMIGERINCDDGNLYIKVSNDGKAEGWVNVANLPPPYAPPLSMTPTPTPTITPSVTMTGTPGASPTATSTLTPTLTPTITPSVTVTSTPAPSFTANISYTGAVRWYPNPFFTPLRVDINASGYGNITQVRTYSRSAASNPPTAGAWVLCDTQNPGTQVAALDVNYTPAAGVGYYQFSAEFDIAGYGTYFSICPDVVHIINNNVTSDISGGSTAALGGTPSLSSNAADSSNTEVLTVHGFEYKSPGSSTWLNCGEYTGPFSYSDNGRVLFPALPVLNQVGTWTFRSYATNCSGYLLVNTYSHSSEYTVTVS